MTEYRDINFNPPPSKFVASDGTTYNGCLPPEPELLAAGFYPCVSVPKPDGNYRESWALSEGAWQQTWEAYDPQIERLDSLQPYISKVDTLVMLLMNFDIHMPIDRETVTQLIYAKVKVDINYASEAMLLMSLISELDKVGITDDDIYLIARRNEN